MAKKEKSRAELLAEQVKAGAVKRRAVRGPSYVFSDNQLKHIREELGLTQAMVAEETQTESAAISAIERGADPRLSTAMRLCAFYGMPPANLFGNASLYIEAMGTPPPPVAPNETDQPLLAEGGAA